jgi:sigma-B regulation protein RsbQ
MQNEILKPFNVRISGISSQPMIFAHGLGCDQNVWRRTAPLFENEYQVVLFDYIGSGKSDLRFYNREKYSSLQGYADDVVTIAQALGLTDIIFVGHSVSCMIGLLAAISAPGLFQKIIMIAPSPCYLNDKDYKGGFERQEIEDLLEAMEQDFKGWATMLSPSVVGNEDRPELAKEWEDSVCRTDPSITCQFAEVVFLSDNRADLPKLSTPAFILQCSDDVLAPAQVGEYVHQNVQNSTLHYLRATGHSPHITAPEETVTAIRQYLASHPLPKAAGHFSMP